MTIDDEPYVTSDKDFTLSNTVPSLSVAVPG